MIAVPYCYDQAVDVQLKPYFFDGYFEQGSEFLNKNNKMKQFMDNPDSAYEIGLIKFIDNFAFVENRRLTEYIIRNGIWKFDAIELFYVDLLFSKLRNEKIDFKDKLNKAKRFQERLSNPPKVNELKPLR